mgnify:FL=1
MKLFKINFFLLIILPCFLNSFVVLASDYNNDWYNDFVEVNKSYKKGLKEYRNKNYLLAYNILLPLAENNVSFAQSDIAGLFFNGWGVSQDYKKAFFWYKKSADNNNSYAQYKLGHMYWKGLGVRVDTDEAQVWWKLSADNGYRDAQFALPYQYCYIGKPQCN